MDKDGKQKLKWVQGFFLLLAFTSVDGNTCDGRCQDYLVECSSLPYSETGDIPECKQERYQTYCPMTCKICQKCDKTEQLVRDLGDLANRLATLENHLSESVFTENKKELKQLKIYNATSRDVFLNNHELYAPSKLFDGNLNTKWNGGGCFISEGNGDGSWVYLFMTKVYQVTEIFLLNVDSGLGNQHYTWIEGGKVSVCRNESNPQENCELFATIQEAPRGGWIKLTPWYETEGFEGNIIRIENYIEHLHLCEVLLLGRDI